MKAKNLHSFATDFLAALDEQGPGAEVQINYEGCQEPDIDWATFDIKKVRALLKEYIRLTGKI